MLCIHRVVDTYRHTCTRSGASSQVGSFEPERCLRVLDPWILKPMVFSGSGMSTPFGFESDFVTGFPSVDGDNPDAPGIFPCPAEGPDSKEPGAGLLLPGGAFASGGGSKQSERGVSTRATWENVKLGATFNRSVSGQSARATKIGPPSWNFSRGPQEATCWVLCQLCLVFRLVNRCGSRKTQRNKNHFRAPGCSPGAARRWLRRPWAPGAWR